MDKTQFQISPPLIAILRHITPDECVDVMEHLIDAGFNLIEVPMNSENALSSIEKMAQKVNKRALIGAGTVIHPSQVSRILNAGGELIISPNTNPDVITKTKQLGMLSIPGCITPTEIFSALNAGADAIKLFPAEQISPNIMSSLKAVLPKNTSCLMVGGINIDNMSCYLKAGAAGFGIGSSLYKPGKSLAQIQKDAHQIMQAFQQANQHANQLNVGK